MKNVYRCELTLVANLCTLIHSCVFPQNELHFKEVNLMSRFNALLISASMIAAFLGWYGNTNSLQNLSVNEMDRRVSDNCGAATNLEWSECGWDEVLCEAEKLTVTNGTFKIPGTGISLPWSGKIYEWEQGCKAGGGKTSCNKKQHEQAVAAPGNRVNDGFPQCGGVGDTYKTFECGTIEIVIPVLPGWQYTYPCIKNGVITTCTIPLTNPVEITIPHGCQEKPGTRSIPNVCPNQYQKMKGCTST